METWEKVLNGKIIEYSQFRNIQTMKLSNIYLNFTFKYIEVIRRPSLSDRQGPSTVRETLDKPKAPP